MTNLGEYGLPGYLELKHSWTGVIFGLALLLTGVGLGYSIATWNDRYPSSHTANHLRSYSTTWGSSSYDEAVWNKVQLIADMMDLLPPVVTTFKVQARSTLEPYPFIVLTFRRTALEQLQAGDFPPALFMREHVIYDLPEEYDRDRRFAMAAYRSLSHRQVFQERE
ncbi:MAG: hypothetical protein JSW54_10740 [Fidelibacterota bacterium]|nr:MAG: hypothetical protein JSW54_10740 [Candidatus Neomarinimicrobiota bacterium]